MNKKRKIFYLIMAAAFLTLLIIQIYRGFSQNKFEYFGMSANALLLTAMILGLRDLNRADRADKL